MLGAAAATSYMAAKITPQFPREPKKKRNLKLFSLASLGTSTLEKLGVFSDSNVPAYSLNKFVNKHLLHSVVGNFKLCYPTL